MLAGAGKALSAQSGNAVGAAVGDMTQQGIAAKNQAAWIAKLLGLGGGAEAGGITAGLGGWDRLMNAHPDNKMTFDGSKMNITGDAESLSKAFGSTGALAIPQAPMQTSALATPSAGGQQGILNPSSGLLGGGLSGLSLAGLKPEDINKAITLGLAGTELERKKVSDLLQSRYWNELITEKEAARGAKNVSSPVGEGLSLAQFNAYPNDVKAHLYVNYLRKQSGQAPISYEQFKQQSDTNSTMQLVDRANRDKAFKDTWFASKAVGATNINLSNEAARQEQKNAINNFDDLKKPGNSKLFDITEDEQRTVRRSIDITLGNKEYNQAYSNALTKAKIDKALALVKGTGVEILEKETKLKGNELIIPVITKTGARDVIRRIIK
jgi:hypothetical protein